MYNLSKIEFFYVDIIFLQLTYLLYVDVNFMVTRMISLMDKVYN